MESPAASPRTYNDIHTWLRDTLEATHETPRQVSLRIGLSKNAMAEMLAHPERVPHRPTLDKLASYFGVDPAELRAMRPKRADRIALGHRQFARLGVERLAEITAKGQASRRKKQASLTPEQRSALARATGAASRRRNTAEDFARMGALGEQVMRERGYKHTAEGRAIMSERVKRTGQSAAGARAAHAKYGRQHPGLLAMQRLWAIPGARRLQRIRLWAYRFETGDIRAQMLKRAHAAHQQLVADGPRRGRPAQLLSGSDRERAIEAARLRDDEKLTKGEIARRFGLSTYTSQSRYTRNNRDISVLIALGRAQRGTPGTPASA